MFCGVREFLTHRVIHLKTSAQICDQLLWQWSGWFCGPRGRKFVCRRLSPRGLRPMQSRHCKQRSDCMAFRLANFIISYAIPFDVLGNLAARICLALPPQRESARGHVRSTEQHLQISLLVNRLHWISPGFSDPIYKLRPNHCSLDRQ